MAAGKGSCIHCLEYHRGGTQKASQGGYDMTSLQTVVPCHIAGMLALSCLNIFFSNSLINLQDMWMKDFNYIALVYN